LPEKKAGPRTTGHAAAPGAPAKRREGAPVKARDGAGTGAGAKPPRSRATDERAGERRTTERRTDDAGRRAPRTAEGRVARPAFGDNERGQRGANRTTATTERRAPRAAGSRDSRDSRDTRAPFGDKERSPRTSNRASADSAGGRGRGNADERRPRTERAERTDRPFRSAERPPRDASSPAAGARKIARPVKEAAASPSGSGARRARTGEGSPGRGAPAGDSPRRLPSEARARPGIGKRSDAAKPSKPAAPRVGSPVRAAPTENRGERAERADGLVRLSKRMSELGLCSRREADEWIENGWVRVDGERIDTLGSRVRPDQQIEVTRDAHVAQSRQVTILLNKPVGYVSGQAEDGYEPAVTLITADNRWEGDRATTRFVPSHLRALAPAGRLDIDSTGLLVLTQDGRIAKQLIGEHSSVEKEYLVRVSYGELTTDIDRHFPADKLALLRFGLSLDDTPLKPAKVSWQNGEQLRFVLREGKKRQIRRMCELVGLHVVGLKRVRMGRVALGALPQGQWRYLLPDEAF
jgi:23S rRNA pseudouridine2604 synthase